MEKELENILDKHAKENMISWNLESFKKDYPTLFKTILNSMEEVKEISEIKGMLDVANKSM